MKCVVCGRKRWAIIEERRPIFHHFPKKEYMKNKWLAAIGKPLNTVINYTRDSVCSYHFNEDQAYSKKTLKNNLLSSAVPSINLGQNISKTQKLNEDIAQQSLVTTTKKIPVVSMSISQTLTKPGTSTDRGTSTECPTSTEQGTSTECPTSTDQGTSTECRTSTKPLLEEIDVPLTKNKYIYVIPKLLRRIRHVYSQTDKKLGKDKGVQCKLIWTRKRKNSKRRKRNSKRRKKKIQHL